MTHSINIVPINQPGDNRTGGITGLTVELITAVLGFPPNVQDDPEKVKYSWGFTADGVRCGIWNYKGSDQYGEWSTFGPKNILVKLFGGQYTAWA